MEKIRRTVGDPPLAQMMTSRFIEMCQRIIKHVARQYPARVGKLRQYRAQWRCNRSVARLLGHSEQGTQMSLLLRIKPIRQTPPDGPLLFRWQGQNASVQPYLRLQPSGACAKHRDWCLPPPDTGRLAFFRDQREILVRSGNQIVGERKSVV